MTTLSPPTTPQHEMRPRAVSAMSHTSNRSRRSNSSSNKIDLTESPKDKKRLNTKADPSKALVEAQPAAVALEESNLDDLRRVQHHDKDGNMITDPDRSNPTRNRLERPLDTIRAFNAAAEGTTTRRSSYGNRPESQYGNNREGSRPGSYYGANPGYSPSRPRPGYGGYYRNSSYGNNAYGNHSYGNSSYGMGPQSMVEESPGSSQQYARGWRQPSNPYYGYNNENTAPVHQYQHSNDTMTSASDENGKSTNPSSHNSSYDQLHQVRKQEDQSYPNPYVNDFQFSPIASQQPYAAFDKEEQYMRQPASRPAPPPKELSYTRPNAPIPLNSSNPRVPPPRTLSKSSTSGKRQSLIMRMFSRRDS